MLKNFIALVCSFALVLTAVPAPVASAAEQKTKATPLGIDISWPQCGQKVPTNQAFAIVGVNGGLANNTNKCLAEQLVWAKKSVGGTNQDKLQLYVNTANPSGLNTDSWTMDNLHAAPMLGTENPYGPCYRSGDGVHGESSPACAWRYGWNRAYEDTTERFPRAAELANISQEPSDYMWWLDVETLNTWDLNGSKEAFINNTAVIEGMATHFKHIGARTGVYATNMQWGEITGEAAADSEVLNGLPVWYPIGRAREDNAKKACQQKPLTIAGKVVMTQFINRNLDYNYSCIN